MGTGSLRAVHAESLQSHGALAGEDPGKTEHFFLRPSDPALAGKDAGTIREFMGHRKSAGDNDG